MGRLGLACATFFITRLQAGDEGRVVVRRSKDSPAARARPSAERANQEGHAEPDRLRSERIKKGMPSPYEVQTREAEAKITPRFGWFSSAPAAAPAAAPAEAPAEPPAAAPRDASAPRPAAMPPSGRRDASPPTARPPESAEPAKAIADVAASGSGGGGLVSWVRGHPSSQSEKAADELARRLTC